MHKIDIAETTCQTNGRTTQIHSACFVIKQQVKFTSSTVHLQLTTSAAFVLLIVWLASTSKTMNDKQTIQLSLSSIQCITASASEHGHLAHSRPTRPDPHPEVDTPQLSSPRKLPAAYCCCAASMCHLLPYH